MKHSYKTKAKSNISVFSPSCSRHYIPLLFSSMDFVCVVVAKPHTLIRHSTIEELLDVMFSLGSVPKSQQAKKQGPPHHWQFSKAHTGPRIA
jgi:hypothetical protein